MGLVARSSVEEAAGMEQVLEAGADLERAQGPPQDPLIDTEVCEMGIGDLIERIIVSAGAILMLLFWMMMLAYFLS
jgi:hypothetical protein